jgi:hypothetical protein
MRAKRLSIMEKTMVNKNEYFPQSVLHPGIDLKEKLE